MWSEDTGSHSGPPRSLRFSLHIEWDIDVVLWLSWVDTAVRFYWAVPNMWRTWQMVGFALSTWLCTDRPHSPAVLYLFLQGPEIRKWLWAVIPRSPCWRSSFEHPVAWSVVLLNVLLVLGMGALSRPKPILQDLEHDWHVNIKFTSILTRTNLNWKYLSRIVSCIPAYILA